MPLVQESSCKSTTFHVGMKVACKDVTFMALVIFLSFIKLAAWSHPENGAADEIKS